MENKEPKGRKISKEEMAEYDKKLSAMSLEILKMPISVVKSFSDYLTNAVNFSSWVADLHAKGLTYDVITIEEYNKKYPVKDATETPAN